MPERISVVGVVGDGLDDLSAPGRRALAAADLVVGGRRLLDNLAPPGARTVVIEADVDAALEQVAAEVGSVCVLASGDPGFFGIVRVLGHRFGPTRLHVHPEPSSVALAFARLGLPWDDAAVVSAHGRPLAAAAGRAVGWAKVAVLVSPDAPPEALGKELLAQGATHDQVVVCSRLGSADERVERTGLEGLAGGTWDPRSVVVLLHGDGVPGARTLAWGLPEDDFAHRGGMITKSEVRAVVLARLELPATGVVWDVGAGSGSVAVECAALRPALRVLAIERGAGDAGRVRHNATDHGVAVETVEGEAPEALGDLPAPDRAFVGGGGLVVLDAVLARLRPGGRVVASYAALDRASEAMGRLGSLVQLGVAHGQRLPDGGVRLAAENPVFVAWGPEP
ncbi:MAG: precorrin-6y C5,15-methyltransferase (decarboxylating) subunit CbiE [Actinomycetota bacterium]|nr:precorrin-6y C5,15-methyltransferase (decarboxylating) subunit CbiE [Actinomycetota bacterium]